MRFLCLHGMGTNSRVLEIQTGAALRRALGSQHEFEFVEGTVPCPAAPGIEKLLSPTDECFSYFVPDTPPSVVSALDELEEYVAAEGPFHAVMGFSQGAALAATLMIRHQQEQPAARPLFSCGVFLCAGAPYDPAALQVGQVVFLGDTDEGYHNGELINVPTAHIVGEKDEALSASLALSRVCKAQRRKVFNHGGSHNVPSYPEHVVRSMADLIEDVIRKALFLQ